MIENEALESVMEWLLRRRLADALSAMEAYYATRPRLSDIDRLYAIRSDFQLMADYWKRGYKDPQLAALYDNLLKRLYEMYVNAALAYAVGHSTFLSSVYMRLNVTARDRSTTALRESLETFVSEVAMLELEPEHKRVEKQKDVYRRHHQLMSEWFDNVWLSTIWTDSQAASMEDILLSPTVDNSDQQLLVSGITLSVVNHYDSAKFRTLLHVYRKSSDESVRQRALVGWVLALGDLSVLRLFGDDIKEMELLLEDKDVCQELMQLQQQLVFCINAEKDNQTIQREIMPDLLKNSDFRVTRTGIEEIEDTPLADILHPDEEERRAEQVEESFLRMQDMQRQGSDIYFGGFSQMKHFPFFNDICNWFVPFYMDHPEISGVVDKFRANKFLGSMLDVGPFCGSDKYSFLLAFTQVMERIPQKLREMLDRGEASIGEISKEESHSAAFIRRTYLQDLYRFYRLYSHRGEFRNPFDNDYYLFFADRAFSQTHLEPFFTEIGAFLIKQKRMCEAGKVLDNCGPARRDFRYYMMAGYLIQHRYYVFEDLGQDDLACYREALEFQPENERALLGYARALFSRDCYLDAIEAYNRLLELYPEKKNYLLNRSVCLTRLGRYAEAQKDLFRLNYESPEDKNVSRVLAWVLTCDDKYEQAENIYAQLLSDEAQAEDLLNYGYCLWLGGSVDEAVDCFHRYLKDSEKPAEYILENEAELLHQKGITEAEMQMMLYML